jgi:DNA-binding NarL/FixJ family response regulator
MEAIADRSVVLLCAASDTSNALSNPEWQRVVCEVGLSVQQARIVELILAGRADKEIAREMGLRVPTVRTYLSRIFQRTGCTDRINLVVKVFQCVRELREKNGGP